MFKVAIINCVYPPEPVVSAQMGRDLAEHLAQNGARVTVLCPFPTRPFGAVYQGTGEREQESEIRGQGSADSKQGSEDGRLRYEVETTPSQGGQPASLRSLNYAEPRRSAGFVTKSKLRRAKDVGYPNLQVVHLPSFTAPESRLLPRMWESFSFGWHVCRYLKQHLTDIDVVYANTWPLFSQAMIARYCNRRGIPLILHIQDIYPESLMGKLPSFLRSMTASLLITLDRWTVRQVMQIVVISENMRKIYLTGRGLAPEKVVVIPNWTDENRFACLPERKDACVQYGIPEENFTFLYLGNIGPVAGVEELIKAFHATRLKQAQLVIAGDGSVKETCVDLVERIGCNGIKFVSPVNVENAPLIQSMAHVCLLPLRKGAGMSSIPSKLPAYMFSAKPILATVDAESDTARFIMEAQCGWVGEPENVEWLSKKMTEITTIPADVLSEMGAKGREYGLKHFSKAQGVRRLGDVVEGMGRQRDRGQAEGAVSRKQGTGGKGRRADIGRLCCEDGTTPSQGSRIPYPMREGRFLPPRSPRKKEFEQKVAKVTKAGNLG
ncbi:MAG: hypothetical protein A2283_16885 [Lentisphaerae bacterium RIFOXYA12_FULL_48_11]|nr:MAG: hypothetical protein A2283_16885 [Lentisphaerae bacterium RIFOXYA12_FULL_48_11]